MKRPLDNRVLFHTRNPDKARMEVSKVHCDHSLNIHRGSSINARYHHAPLASLSLNFIEYGADVQIGTAQLGDFFLIQLPVQGSALIQSGKREGLSKPGMAAILSAGQDLRMRCTADCQQLLVKINRVALEQQLIQLIGTSLDKPLEFELLMPSGGGEVASWWRMVEFLMVECEHAKSLVVSGPSVAKLEQTLMTSLLYAQPHNYSLLLNSNDTAIAPIHVKRAEAYMQEHIADFITVEDLTAVAGVSTRTLNYGFRHFRQTTPMNYLRKIRLENVRKNLMCPSADESVTSIATKWGFSQMGRFSGLYKQAYGELPSVTLRRCHLRGSLGPSES